MTSDLYEVLVVPRDATEAEITRAYRAWARKCHPDIVGEERREEFDLLTLARDILLDSKRRAHYDRTGEAVPLQPDNSTVPLMTSLSTAYSAVIGKLVNEGLDPTGGDMLGAMSAYLLGEHKSIFDQIASSEKGLEKIKRTSGRFSVKDPDLYNHLEDMVTAQIAGFEQSIKIARERIPGIESALDYLGKCSYRIGP